MWNFSEKWGDEAEAVREYLKREWMKVRYHFKEVDIREKENLREEAEQILTVKITYCVSANFINFYIQWWWTNRYSQRQHYSKNSSFFGSWLFQHYQENGKVDESDNRVPIPRSTIVLSCVHRQY